MKTIFQNIHINYGRKNHIPAFDGVRGASIIVVTLYHYFLLPYAAWFSMESFFVLSGFLITGILLDIRERKNFFKNYLARRMLRILPLYYGLLIIAFFIVPLFVSKESLAPFSLYYHHQEYFWIYLQNWLLLYNEAGLKGVSRIMLHLWSLAIEEQFYIVWPLLVLIFNRKVFTKIIAGIILFSITLKCYFHFSGYPWQENYFNTFCRLDSLSMGGLIAVCVRDKSFIPFLNKTAPYIFKLLGAVLLIAILIYRPRMPGERFLEPLGTTLFAILFAGMLLYCLSDHKRNYVKRFLELRLFTFLGKYSYSLYIFHVPILVLIRHRLTALLQEHIKGGAAFLLSSIICLTFTFLFSRFTWIAIEKPALKLKKFFKYADEKTEPLSVVRPAATETI
ncbi:acyltransferase family protein [Parafilimonas sp.]|uniref:acyltransferase family protein n=1 Tax=Parafilimonas sp. TaxID=1969739 RepID=UPI0039E63CB8